MRTIAVGNETFEEPRLRAPFRPITAATSFEQLYRREYEPMVRVARFITGDLGTAEEAVQDAFVQVHQRFDRLDNPGGYLRICVMNRCHDGFRRTKRLRARLPLLAVDPHDVGRLRPDTVEGSAERTDLVEALQALPVRMRAAIVLRYYGGLTEADIAEALEVRPGTVKSLIHRGLARLRQEVTP